jgi:hypothetical protein
VGGAAFRGWRRFEHARTGTRGPAGCGIADTLVSADFRTTSWPQD